MSRYHKAAGLAVVVTIFALPITSAAADSSHTPGPLTLDDCVSIAMSNAVTMANAVRDQQIVGMQVKQARSRAFPQLSIKGDYTRLDELQSFDMEDGPVELGVLNNYSASLNVSQILFSGGRVSAAIRAARLAADLADEGLAETRSSLIRDVSIDFFAVLLAKSAVDVQRESEARLKLFAEHVKDKLNTGAASELDWLTADARYRTAIPVRIAAENTVQLAENALYRRIGVDADSGYSISGELVPTSRPLSLERARQMAMTNSPAIAQMEITINLFEQRARAARSGMLPTVSAFAAVTEANSYGFAAADESWETHWNAGLTFEWSLFDGGATRATVREKRLDMEKKSAELDDLKRIVKLEIRQAHLAYEQAAKAIAAGNKAVTVAEKALVLATSRHDLGLATGLDVSEANLLLKQARLALAVAMHDQNVAVARLKHASGMTATSFEPERDN